MAPALSALQVPQSPTPSSDIETFPPLGRSSTLPVNLHAAAAARRADPSHLAPEDAFFAHSPPRQHVPSPFESGGGGGGGVASVAGVAGHDIRSSRLRHKSGSRGRSRRRKRFQKLLWVKQSYPDNYTDEATFLENLQRNPRLQPYEFWPLVADSTVIVQHVCSVIVFVVCFVGIFQERVSPVSVVGWGSFATFLGWLLWDYWVGQEEREHEGGGDDVDGAAADGLPGRNAGRSGGDREDDDLRLRRRQGSAVGGGLAASSQYPGGSTPSASSLSNLPSAASSTSNLHAPSSVGTSQDSSTLHMAGLRRLSSGGGAGGTSGPASQQQQQQQQHQQQQQQQLLQHHSNSNSATHLPSARHAHSASATSLQSAATDAAWDRRRRPSSPSGGSGGRAYVRLSTIKSAVLIYFTLLALSPILKSLTRSTSSDSIWAMSFWLLALNVFFFDYSEGGAGPAAWWSGPNRFPAASLSTNAGLMASTVLASRLPSTGQVFSLTLFSIEVFGLFPVFRRCARRRSWRYHVALTVLLVLGAGGGVGMVLGGGGGGGDGTVWPWRGGLLGMVVGCLIAAVAMGGCSWWLIGLQKYKNEIYGPWDPARPIIISRRHWDDE